MYITEAVGRSCSAKIVFLKISQNSQENNFIKRETECFSLNFMKFSRAYFSQNTSERLFLETESSLSSIDSYLSS